MEDTELHIRHREFIPLAWISLAVMVCILTPLLSGQPLWAAVLGYAVVAVGFFCMLYAGCCEEVLTAEGICCRQPLARPRFCSWKQVRQVGVLVQPGKPVTPVLAITAAGGKPWETAESYWKWLRKNPETGFEVEYNRRTMGFVLRYYGPLDFDEWKRPAGY